jgi:hypothetical protein
LTPAHAAAYAAGRRSPLRRKTALVAAAISIAASTALVVPVIAIDKAIVTLILAPAIVGSVPAMWRPEHRGVLALAVVLIALTAVVSLIGGVGLLYLPSIVLLIWCIVPTSAPRGTSSNARV